MMLSLIAAAAFASTTPRVTLQGVGDLRIGMPVAALRHMGARLNGEIEPGSTCAYWRIAGREGLAMMVVDGRLVRIDIDNPRYRTARGARLGMSEAAVRRLYSAALVVRPHPYTGPEGHYLVYHVRGARDGLIFETNHQTHRIESMRVGRWEEVQWIEGCS